MKRLMGKEKGFTLIELMIVILIIAILVAIAIPLYMSIQENAKVNACKGTLRIIDGGVAQYNASAGVMPADVPAMVAGSFLKSTPKCPAGTAAYELDTSHTASCMNGVSTHHL